MTYKHMEKKRRRIEKKQRNNDYKSIEKFRRKDFRKLFKDNWQGSIDETCKVLGIKRTDFWLLVDQFDLSSRFLDELYEGKFGGNKSIDK